MNRPLALLTILTLTVAVALLIGAAIAVAEMQQWVPRPHLLSTTLGALRCAPPA